MTPKWHIPRRTLLRGVGTGVALPLLEAMLTSGPRARRAQAAADPKANPRRFVGMWGFPCGLVNKWDPVQNAWVSPWTPAQEGALTQPDEAGFLKPFWDAQNQGANKSEPLYKKLTILTGLSDIAMQLHQGVAGLLIPGRLQCRTEDNNCQDLPLDTRAPSADQVAAKYLGQYTDIPYLALGTHAAGYAEYPYEIYLSWKDHATPAAKDIDPALVFDKLFAGTIDPMEDKTAAARRKLLRTSVLDTIIGHANAIKARVGKADQAKLGDYLDGIREIENGIDKVGATLTCTRPGRPNPGSTPGADLPPMNDRQAWINHLDQRVKLMMDLMVKAFECDRTRVATLTYINSYGAYYGYPFLGLDGYHHDMSHYNDTRAGGGPGNKVPYMNAWGKFVVKMYAYFAGELDKRLDPDGNTLLDNSVIYIGGDCSDGTTHSWNSVHGLLAGRGGRAPTGRWAVNAGQHVRVSPPWPGNACGFTDSNQNIFYCRDASGTARQSPYQIPDYQFDGERTARELIWGMLEAIGIPGAADWAHIGAGRRALDLTFS